MKKSFIAFLVLLSIGQSSCEKDDFCTLNPVTPNLVLRFYDNDDKDELKNVTRLSVILRNETDTLINATSTDSIAIPLNTNAMETIYTLIKNESEDGNEAANEEATLTITYEPEDDYVSRSCGFRVIFNNVNFTSSGWIDELSTEELESIKTQENAHVNIFH